MRDKEKRCKRGGMKINKYSGRSVYSTIDFLF